VPPGGAGTRKGALGHALTRPQAIRPAASDSSPCRGRRLQTGKCIPEPSLGCADGPTGVPGCARGRVHRPSGADYFSKPAAAASHERLRTPAGVQPTPGHEVQHELAETMFIDHVHVPVVAVPECATLFAQQGSDASHCLHSRGVEVGQLHPMLVRNDVPVMGVKIVSRQGTSPDCVRPPTLRVRSAPEPKYVEPYPFKNGGVEKIRDPFRTSPPRECLRPAPIAAPNFSKRTFLWGGLDRVFPCVFPAFPAFTLILRRCNERRFLSPERHPSPKLGTWAI
jgi:hypothetical protein